MGTRLHQAVVQLVWLCLLLLQALVKCYLGLLLVDTFAEPICGGRVGLGHGLRTLEAIVLGLIRELALQSCWQLTLLKSCGGSPAILFCWEGARPLA